MLIPTSFAFKFGLSITYVNKSMLSKVSLAFVVALLGLALFSLDKTPADMSFDEYMSAYGLKYDSKVERTYRERVFLQNLAKINAHNSQNDKTYEMGINQFTHLTQEEFASTYLGTKVPKSDSVDVDETFVSVGDVDWVAAGAVTPIKDQGQCGSCWAFSTTGGLEGLSKLGFGTLQSFSEQQLVDCSLLYGNHGCSGGLMDNAFRYVKDHGITGEQAYPYVAKKETCQVKQGEFKISGHTDVAKSCTNLANDVTGRPISVAVDAANWSPYKSGVFSGCGTSLDHGVLLVGVTDQYWRVKNSWTAGWGEQGFIRLARGNTCGICNQASYPNK